MNFHIIPVGSGVIREVIINNTSKCPVTYEIQVPEKYKVDPNAPPEKPEKSKGKDNKYVIFTSLMKMSLVGYMLTFVLTGSEFTVGEL